MGAGSFKAGVGTAGLDPVAPVDAPRDVTPPVALWWDAASKDYLLDAAGRFKSLHPVDQKVGLALTLQGGTISSVPNMGTRLRAVRYAGGAALKKTVEDIVKLALKTLIDAGDVALRFITVSTPSPGAIQTVVGYTNLRTGKPDSVPLSLSA